MSILKQFETSEKKSVSVYLPNFILKLVDQYGEEEELTRSGVTRLALVEYMRKEGKLGDSK